MVRDSHESEEPVDVRGLTPALRRRLYLACILPLMTYGCQVWYRRKGTKGLIEILRKAQMTAARWITGAFRTSPRGGGSARGAAASATTH